MMSLQYKEVTAATDALKANTTNNRGLSPDGCLGPKPIRSDLWPGIFLIARLPA
jgi:hypothetical protein